MIFDFLFRKKHRVAAVTSSGEGASNTAVINELCARADGLRRLGRDQEAQEVFTQALTHVTAYHKANPLQGGGHLVLALVHERAGQVDVAESLLKSALSSRSVLWDTENKTVARSTLFRIERQKVFQNTLGPEGAGTYTQINCCRKCSRLINFCTVPCPYCQWSPSTIEEMAEATALSSEVLHVRDLLWISGQRRQGKDIHAIWPEFRAVSERRATDRQDNMEHLLALARERRSTDVRSISKVRKCQKCSAQILLSTKTQCDCGAHLPAMVRLIISIDNILDVFEQRVEIQDGKAFSQFVCLLVGFLHDLLWYQEPPNIEQRQVALQLIEELKKLRFWDGAAAIYFTDPDDPEYSIAKRYFGDVGVFMYVMMLIAEIKHLNRVLRSTDMI